MSTPTFSFGTPSSGAAANQPTTSTSAPASGSLFGSTGATAPPTFSFASSSGGAGGAGQTSGSPSLFGNLSGSNTGQKGSLFGGGSSGTPAAATNTAAGSTSVFGQAGGGSAGGLFGSAAKTPSAGGGLFGSSTTTPSSTSAPAGPGLFGNKPGSSTPTTAGGSTSGSVFPPGGLFGSSATTAAALGSSAGTGGLFGGLNKPMFGASSATGQSGAGATSQATPEKPAFSLASTTPAGAPPADSQKTAAASGLFGSGGALSLTQPSQTQQQQQSTPATSMFGQSAKPSPFGNLSNTSTSKPEAAPTAGGSTSSLFGNANTGASQATGGSLFGSGAGSTGNAFAKSSATPATGLFPSLGASSQPASSAATPASVTAASSLPGAQPGGTATSSASGFFGGVSNAANTIPASTKPSLFGASLGTAPTTSAALFGSGSAPSSSAPVTTSATTTSGLLSTPSSTTTSAATSAPTATTAPSLGLGAGLGGGLGGKSTTAAAGTTSTTQPAPTASSTFGGSSAGGPPSQHPRLKNKTMDEIITRWASDLSKYQKEFKEQAHKVAGWDKLLVENGEAIQKLYLSTYEAQRASNEIERQLAAVESQQDELAAWLDRYEGEVDEMFSKQIGQGEQTSGPDQERERTYRLAEKLTDRLDDMGKDLTKMIKEINDMSGTLNKGGKPDDPLSQIVRILNGHLQQLQWIDVNAAALQAKISAAQKSATAVGHQYGGSENDPAESFYRSYIGRR